MRDQRLMISSPRPAAKLWVLLLLSSLLTSYGLAASSWGQRLRLRSLELRPNRFISPQRDAAAAVSNEGTTPTSQELTRRRGMAAALFSTYFAVMGAKVALPSVLSQLTASHVGLSFEGLTSTPQTLMARQLTLATFSVASGKLLLGPVIDRFGGVASLQACLTILMLMLAIIASANHFVTFAAAWIVVDFVFSSCWAGCINAVHQSFPENEWASRIGMIAAAARTGNASAFVMFAAVLQWCSKHLSPGEKPWRLVFAASAALQILPLTLLSVFGRMKPELPESQSGKTRNIELSSPSKAPIQSSLATLKKEATRPAFWMHLVSRSALMVFGSFLLFVPTLMTQIYGLSSSSAARVGSIFAMGCLLSVTTLSRLYSVLGKQSKIIISSSLMGASTLCSLAQLAHMMGNITLTPVMSVLCMFLWGFSFAVPFYIPPSMFALARGGKESSATISDVFDVAGFGLLAVFNGYVASIPHGVAAAWIPTFQILTGCSLASLISLGLATYYE